MAHIILPSRWRIPERQVTDEHVFWNRRRFLKALGYSGLGAAGVLLGCTQGAASPSGKLESAATALDNPPHVPDDVRRLFPAQRSTKYVVERSLTPERVAGTYNNFYEFTTVKEQVADLAEHFQSRPWQIEIGGLVEKPQTVDVDELIRKIPMEERVYRFRCVEAWAMTVPWTGFPLKTLIERVEPKSDAKYIRFVTFFRPEEAVGQKRQPWYPWPYFEGLRMDEAMNELTLLVTGAYGKPLPNQHGAPLRLITPWKYGFKSIKSIAKIEFLPERPATFWNDLAPNEYDFWANVNPAVPHPRWSQATERLLDSGERVATHPFNGYGEFVAHLYPA